MRWKSHVRCGAGEKLEIISKVYLLLWPYAKASKYSAYIGSMRVIDLSEGAFLRIASKKSGVTDVKIDVLERGTWKYKKQ